MPTTCSKENCKRNIPLIEWKCRCEGKFCTKHRLPEKHNCTYNFKLTEEEQQKQRESLMCKNNKMELL